MDDEEFGAGLQRDNSAHFCRPTLCAFSRDGVYGHVLLHRALREAASHLETSAEIGLEVATVQKTRGAVVIARLGKLLLLNSVVQGVGDSVSVAVEADLYEDVRALKTRR